MSKPVITVPDEYVNLDGFYQTEADFIKACHDAYEWDKKNGDFVIMYSFGEGSSGTLSNETLDLLMDDILELYTMVSIAKWS